MRLTWDLPARKLRNGDIIMYQITYHKLADSVNEEDLNITDTFVDIVGLEMNTDYIFKIKAYTSRGAGPWSNRLHFRTFGRSECCCFLAGSSVLVGKRVTVKVDRYWIKQGRNLQFGDEAYTD